MRSPKGSKEVGATYSIVNPSSVEFAGGHDWSGDSGDLKHGYVQLRSAAGSWTLIAIVNGMERHIFQQELTPVVCRSFSSLHPTGAVIQFLYTTHRN